MDNMKKYTTDGLSVQFKFQDIKNIIVKALDESSNEIGGIITGKYCNDRKDAIINTFHLPTRDSIRKPFNFIRGKKGITNLLKELWQKVEYYIGEWHLHPYASPNASNVDLQQLLDISKKTDYKCPEPILIIIGSDKINFNMNVYIAIGENIKQMQLVAD